jgi:hypothetical protein
VLQTLDGAVRVAVWPDRLKLSAGALSVTIGPTAIDVVGVVNFHDPVNLLQTLDVAGHAVLAGGAEIGGVEFGTHEHPYGTLPGGTSAGPVNP